MTTIDVRTDGLAVLIHIDQDKKSTTLRLSPSDADVLVQRIACAAKVAHLLDVRS